MSSRVIVKQIKPKGVLSLSRLFKKALQQDFSYFPSKYLKEVKRLNSYSRLLRASTDKKRQLLGLYDGRKLVGYSISGISSSNEGYIFWVYIRPEMRGLGFGKELIQKTLTNLKKSGVSNVQLMTHQFEDFYKSMGFDTIYKNDELFNEIVMYEMAKEIDV